MGFAALTTADLGGDGVAGTIFGLEIWGLAGAGATSALATITSCVFCGTASC